MTFNGMAPQFQLPGVSNWKNGSWYEKHENGRASDQEKYSDVKIAPAQGTREIFIGVAQVHEWNCV